jgi:hypothetical protein
LVPKKLTGWLCAKFSKEILMSEAVSVIPTKILVPIDFSASSHAALDAATELAEKFHAELYLLHVIPEFPAVVLHGALMAGLERDGL